MLTFQIFFDRKYFDGWSLSFTKHSIALKFDGLDFDGLAGKHRKFPQSKFPAYSSHAIAII